MSLDFFSRYRLKNILYLLIISSAIICNITAFILDIITYKFYPLVMLYPIMIVLFLTIGIVGSVTRKKETALIVLLVILDFFEMPVVYYLYGNNALPFLLLNISCNAVFLKQKSRLILLPLTFLAYVITVVFSHYHPQKFIDLDAADRTIPAIVSFFAVAVILDILSIALISQYNVEKKKNSDLRERIDAMSKRDPLTNTFSKLYAEDYITYMIENTESFSASVYKIASYEKLEAKYGSQFCDVGTISLSEEIIKAAAGISLIARYSNSTFIVVYSENDTEDVRNAVSQIDDAIRNGISKYVDVISFTETFTNKDTLKTVLNKMSTRVGGFGE